MERGREIEWRRVDRMKESFEEGIYKNGVLRNP